MTNFVFVLTSFIFILLVRNLCQLNIRWIVIHVGYHKKSEYGETMTIHIRTAIVGFRSPNLLNTDKCYIVVL